MTEEWYPRKLQVDGEGTAATYDALDHFYSRQSFFSYAELGIYRGDTARNVCERFPNATLFLFDFTEKIEEAKSNLDGYPNKIFYFTNSQRYNDSYNWSLMKLIEQNTGPIFDYCFIDGAHTVAIDGLAFFLCDLLLRDGGFIDFDDYNWRIRGSSLDPDDVPEMGVQYTDEQVDSFQIKMIIDNLVKRDARYMEIAKNRLFRKFSDNRCRQCQEYPSHISPRLS